MGGVRERTCRLQLLRVEMSVAKSPSTDDRFRALFDAYHRELHAYCLRRLPIDDANDAAAEVFLVAWRRPDKVPAGDQARLWLYGVARNTVHNWRRSERRQLRLVNKAGSLAPEVIDGPETLVVRNEEHHEVHEALAMLRDTSQEIVRMKVWEGLSDDEVGAILGISGRAVEGRYHRAIKKLSKQLMRGHPAATPSSPFSSERGEAAL